MNTALLINPKSTHRIAARSATPVLAALIVSLFVQIAYAQDKATVAATVPAAVVAPQFADDNALQTAVDARFTGDYTGLCVAIAVVDASTVRRANTCADKARAQKIDAASLFEIGSISKTMLAVLVADLIDQGKMKLDAPISNYLPAGTKMPPIKGRAITVQDIVTHTSGLPALPGGMENANPADPYAKLTEAALLEALPKASLPTEAG